MAQLTNDELLAYILQLERDIAAGGGGGSSGGDDPGGGSGGMDSAIAAKIVTYLKGTTWNEIMAGRTVTADNAWDEYMRALNVMCVKLNSDIENIDVPDSTAITTLIAEYLSTHDLSGYLKGTSPVFEGVTAQTLFSRVGEFLQLITENLTAQGIQAFSITSDHLTINNAAITDAMIASVNANKINSGSINTNKVHIFGDDDHLIIADGNIKIDDGTYVRVQIGRFEGETEDDDPTYDMAVWDEDGNLMWDASGITREAIKSAIIDNECIADDANIDASKIDISTLVSCIEEDGSLTMRATNIIVDANNQKLSAWYQTMNSWKSDLGDSLNTINTKIQMLDGKIETVITEDDITSLRNDITTATSNASTALQTANGFSASISAIQTTNTALSGRMDDIDDDISNLSDTVGTYRTDITQAKTDIDLLADKFTVIQNKTLLTESEVGEVTQQYASEFEASAQALMLAFQNAYDSTLEGKLSKTEYHQNFLFDAAGLHMLSDSCPIEMTLSSRGIEFIQKSDNKVLGYWDGNYLYTGNIYVRTDEYARFGDFAWVPNDDGSLSLVIMED